MRTLEQRAALDEFELEADYDFSNGVRGRFYSAKKVSTTIRLDNDVVLLLKKQAAEKHIGYQTLINAILRDYSMHSVQSSEQEKT